MRPRSSALAVHSVDEEDALIGICICGGPWKVSANAVFSRGHRWLDLVRLICASCGRSADHVFDISRFFEPRPGIWTHPS